MEFALKEKRAKKLTVLKKNDCMFIKHSASFRHLIKPFIASSVLPWTFWYTLHSSKASISTTYKLWTHICIFRCHQLLHEFCTTKILNVYFIKPKTLIIPLGVNVIMNTNSWLHFFDEVVPRLAIWDINRFHPLLNNCTKFWFSSLYMLHKIFYLWV